jgi:hypothetical protein
MSTVDTTPSVGALAAATGSYNTLRNFKLDNAYPVVEGYEDAAGHSAIAAGMRLNFSDRVGATGLDVTASFSPGQALDSYERLHLHAVFRHWNWKVTGALNRADFYDLVGPTKSSRRGHSLAVQYQENLYLDGPTSLGYTLRAAAYGGLATLPEFPTVGATFDRLASLNGNLTFTSLRRSLGAVEDELGSTADAAMRANYVNGQTHPRLSLDASHGFLLPLDHSSLWFRAGAGTALGGNRKDPFSRFYFGGFGNNWVDYREVKQFRSAESFPGLGINQVGGATYGKAQVEWTSPPLRFRSVGVPSAYLRWAALSMFGTGLVVDPESAADRRTVGSLGAQLDFRLVTLSHLNSTLSFGGAVAGEKGAPARSTLMVSLKIM